MNLQQHEDRLTALEEKVLGRKPADPPKTEVQTAEDALAAAIKRAKEKAA